MAAYEGDEMVIYPYTPEVVEVAGLVCIQGADHTIDHLNIYPWRLIAMSQTCCHPDCDW